MWRKKPCGLGQGGGVTAIPILAGPWSDGKRLVFITHYHNHSCQKLIRNVTLRNFLHRLLLLRQ
ncbi:MAG: hypothetical protein JWQ21_427 [Herminiimonas sp.]|nr:hypothetical protein [Herminiimonas sp.]